MAVTEQHETLTLGDQSLLCRICLDNDNPNDLISPCLCSGGSAYVHRQCLNNWRSENIRGIGFKFCDICQFEYIIEIVQSEPRAERERLLKYYCFIFRDSLAIMLLVQLVIIGLAFIIKAIDKHAETIKHLFPDSFSGFIIYYMSSFILLLAIVGFIALIIFFCAFTARGSSSSSTCLNGCGGTGKNGLFVGIVVIVLICAVIGLIVGIFVTIIVIRKLMKHHASRLWLRQEADKYIVKDFQGSRQDLEKYKKPLLKPQ